MTARHTTVVRRDEGRPTWSVYVKDPDGSEHLAVAGLPEAEAKAVAGRLLWMLNRT